MFTTQERDRIRDRLLARARADEAIVGAAKGAHLLPTS